MSDDRGRPEPEEIDLSLEDLDDEPLPPPSTGGGGGAAGTLVITSDDLLEIDDSPPAAPGPAYPAPVGGGYPAVPGGLPPVGKDAKGVGAGLVGSLLIQMLIAGAIGGLLAWAANEPRMGRADQPSPDTVAEVFLSTLTFFALAGGIIGLLLGAVEGVSSANWRKALLGGLTGMAIGAVGGAIAGVLGQAAYGFLGGRGDRLSLGQLLARSVGWSIAGLFIGLGQGASGRSVKKVVNGLCGGALGGFAGGLLFDPIGLLMSVVIPGAPGLASRLIALVVIGAASGAAIGLIEELRKEAWLIIVGGPLTGKQFILYRRQTTIGSAPTCDIALLKDPAIAPQQAVIELQGAQAILQDAGTPNGTYVNGQPVRQQGLRAGDVIQMGQTALEYHDRTLPAGAAAGVGPELV
jgi:hypothetical protein